MRKKTKQISLALSAQKNRPGIVLSGHTDVVPVEGQLWVTDPFTIVEKDEKLFGRGTSDMKGFVAICLAFASKFAAADLKMPIHFAFSYDEEVGCVGVRSMTDYIATLDVKPKVCFVGEPTLMQVICGHKGKQAFHAHVSGFECHSSLVDRGVNAVEYSAEVISAIRKLKLDKMKNGPFNQAYDPPFTSVHCGTIKGGTAQNIIPKDCDFSFEWRYVPEENVEVLYQGIKNLMNELEPEMKAIHPNTGFQVDNYASVPALNTDSDSEVVRLAHQFSGTSGTFQVSFATEAGSFNEAGVPTVVIGPGSIEQAHIPNEFVSIEQLKWCENFMENILTYVSE